MKNSMTRMLAILLAMLMIVGAFAMTACGDEVDEEQGDPSGEPGGEENQTPDEEEEERLPLDYLPTTTYGGATINVMEWSVSDSVPGSADNWVPWEEIDVDEGDGDPINNAIYDRNGYVEELYDVVITKEYVSLNGTPQYVTHFRNNESTGDQAYQMITCRTNNIASFCLEGLMTDMNTLENLHTDMPWWSQDSVRSYTMGDALFFAAPEMLLRDKGATAAVFYNQKVASDHEINDLYELAQNGEWTMDIMIEYAEDVTADMDGDDLVSSAEDMYGLGGGGRDIPYFLFAGSGNKFAQIDDDGYLELLYGDEESITIWQDLLDYVMYSDFYYGTNSDKTLLPEGFKPFESDKIFIMMGMVKTVNDLRNMESDYGVLPVPKYDEYQENYSSLVWVHHDSVLGIPGSCANTADMISVVLEHMSYISYYDVYPIFYDTIILGKSARDQQSKEMLELIFRTRSFDPGIYWLETSMHASNSFLTLVETNTTNISSLWAGMQSKVETAVEEFNEKIDELK
jgi:hypothetical protein